MIAIGIALVAGQMIRNNFDRIETEWTNFQKNAYEVGRLQHQLQGAFGYGGYIHKFKNYVLRGEEKLAFAAEAEHARINAIIDIYMNKVKSDEERMALDVVRATFDEYSANLQVAQRMVANGAGPIEIDLVVRVDDGPALAAIATLAGMWSAREVTERERVHDAVAGNNRLMVVGIAALAAFLVFGVVALVFLARLMSRTREAARRAAESETRFRMLAALSPVGIYRADASGRNIYVNERWREITGYEMDDAAREGWAASVHPDDRERVVAAWADFVDHPASNGPLRTECRCLRPDGSVRWVISEAVALQGTDVLPGFVGAVTDITDRVELEDKLVQSQRMEAVGHLTGGVAHDFNNLLAVVMGNLDLAAEELDEDCSSRQYLDGALQAAAKSAALTQRLLSYARKQALNPGAIDLRALVERSDSSLRRDLGELISLDVELPAGLWQCRADAGQLETALHNLCANAHEVMPGGGQVRISASNAPLAGDSIADVEGLEAGDYVRIDVTDTGPGIEPEVLSRMFEPFFTTKDVGEGSGLGFSMVYGFIKQSGGHIEVASEPGSGATISLFLPRAEEAAPEGPSPTQV